MATLRNRSLTHSGHLVQWRLDFLDGGIPIVRAYFLLKWGHRLERMYFHEDWVKGGEAIGALGRLLIEIIREGKTRRKEAEENAKHGK